MSLERAVAVLSAHEHCGAKDWSVSRNGIGRHAFGTYWTERGQFVGISLSAEDAVRLASELQGEA